MNERYALILQRWAAKEILVHEDLYDYRGKETPEVIYDRIYVTADRHLQANAPAFGLPDPMLVFDQDPDPTGAARVTPKVVLTKLSYKIIELLLPHFGDLDETLAQYISDDISLAITKSNMPMAEMLLHYTAIMQYYHEFGHLVQDKDKVSAMYQPPARSAQPSGEVPWSHAREIDADWMSLDQLVKTIIGEYLDEQGQWKKGNLNELEGELSIAFTSVISFFLRATPPGDIYFAEGTHPHPLIRLELIKRNLGPALLKYVPNTITINEAKVIEEAYRFAEGLFEYATMPGIRENFVLQVKEEVQANLAPIEAYIAKMETLALTMEELCMNQSAQALQDN